MILARLTGWGLADLLGLTVEEVGEWIESATDVEKEVAKAAKSAGKK